MPGHDVTLDVTTEEGIMSLLDQCHLKSPLPSGRRDSHKLNTIYQTLARMGFHREDIESTLTLPDCNAVGTALDYLCLRVPHDRLPPDLRGSTTIPSATTARPTTADPTDQQQQQQRPVAVGPPIAASTPNAVVHSTPRPEVATQTPVKRGGKTQNEVLLPLIPAVVEEGFVTQVEWDREYAAVDILHWLNGDGGPEYKPKSSEGVAPVPVKKLQETLKQLEKEYKAERRKADVGKKQKDVMRLFTPVLAMKELEGRAEKLLAGQPLAKHGQCFAVNTKVRQELRELARAAVDSRPSLENTDVVDQLQQEITRHREMAVKKEAESSMTSGGAAGGSGAAAKRGLSTADAAMAGIDRKLDDRWTGKGPTEQLRDWCKQQGYAKPLFEKVASQPEDGTQVRFRCVLVREDKREGREREDFVVDRPYPTPDECRDALSTLVLYKKIGTGRPYYRQLPPLYRDLWLHWMKSEEDEETAAQESRDTHRVAFLGSLVGEVDHVEPPGQQEVPIPPPAAEEPPREEEVAAPQDPTVPSEGAEDASWDDEGPVMDSWEDLEEEGAADDDMTDEQRERSTHMQEEYDRLQGTQQCRAMEEQTQQLPIYVTRSAILHALKTHQVVTISGETGCGKTTQVPQYIVQDWIKRGRGGVCQVVCTQPRRISAISVAERVRGEMSATTHPHLVGYQVRLQRSLTRDTQLLFCTTGILLRKLQSDPSLSAVTHVIVDEVHEMTVQSDFLLTILRELLARRPSLRVILMSATINAQRFANYFEGCATIHVAGRLYPVVDHYLEDVVQLTSYQPDPYGPYCHRHSSETTSSHAESLMGAYSESTIDVVCRLEPSKINYDLIEKLVAHIHANSETDGGAILIFLPGLLEIQTLHDHLLTSSPHGYGGSSSNRFVLISLHSMLAPGEQCQVFERPPPNVRKIVLATNVAETSITIPDVAYVIDTGRMKEVRYDPPTRTTSLVECWVSRANAHQRRGRAGRVTCGQCYHLFPKRTYEQLPHYQLPEILRVPLDDTCLQVKMLGQSKCADFLAQAVQPPVPRAVEEALATLREVDALDNHECLTPLGYHLANLSMDVHVGKLLINASIFQCVEPITIIAAFMSLKSPFLQSVTRGDSDPAYLRFLEHQSDHLTLLNVYRQWQDARAKGVDAAFCKENLLSGKTLHTAEQLKRQLLDNLVDAGFVTDEATANIHSGSVAVVKGVLCSALYPNVLRAVTTAPRGTVRRFMAGNEEVNITSAVRGARQLESPWFVYFEKVKSTQVYVRDCTSVDVKHVILFGPSPDVFHRDNMLHVGAIRITAPPRTSVLLKYFRDALDSVIQQRLRDLIPVRPATGTGAAAADVATAATPVEGPSTTSPVGRVRSTLVTVPDALVVRVLALAVHLMEL